MVEYHYYTIYVKMKYCTIEIHAQLYTSYTYQQI